MARALTDAGHRVVVLERRPVVAGNVYSERVEGLHVHRYGPHILHAAHPRLWEYFQRFATILPFEFRVKARAGGRLYSFPINLQTLHEVFGVATPDEATALRATLTVSRAEGARDAESWARAQVGDRLYRLFLEGYTRKQWQRSPADLDESVLQRLPIRWTERNDAYFTVPYQGLPADGYTVMVERMLAGIEVHVNAPFRLGEWSGRAARIVYSGALDELFGYVLGRLDYRTTRFERIWHPGAAQPTPAVTECDADVPYTRTVEYRHFPPNDLAATPSLLVREYPAAYTPGTEPLYPIPDARNTRLATEYQGMAAARGLLVGGRLGRYRYYDMDQVVASGLEMARRILNAAPSAPCSATAIPTASAPR